MAHQTYLQLINKVMRNLREDQVSDLSAEYTLLVGQYVNQAKSEVEESWKWHQLREDITFDTAVGVNSYDLEDSGTTTSTAVWNSSRSFLLLDEVGRPQAWRDAPGQQMRLSKVAATEGKHQRIINGDDLNQEQPDQFWMQYGQFNFVFDPLEVEQIRVQVYNPQLDLALAADTMTLDVWRPVVDYATWLAMEERGEELGPQAALYLQRFQDGLAQAISVDSISSPSEFVMDAGQLNPYT